MLRQLTVGDIPIDVVFKKIKHLHLSVHPPAGRVRISAPARLSLDTVRVFAISKLAWIERKRRLLQAQERETPREYVDRESHYLWGERYLLELRARGRAPVIELQERRLILAVRPGADVTAKAAIVDRWYRGQLRVVVTELIAKWEPVVGVRVKGVSVRRMKTKWGSCHPRARTIRFNTELAKKPKPCLEYVVVHELVHLLEPSHNARFVALMDKFLPSWKFCRQSLNRLPVRPAEWDC